MRVIHKVMLITVTAMIILSAAAAGFNTFVYGTLDIKHKSAPQHLNIDSPKGRALVIYEPARTDVTKKAALDIARCLNDNGYNVTINYPGDYLTKDVSGYNVVAFGTPVYSDYGSPLITDYIKRVKGLDGKTVLLFTTGYNDTDKAYDGLDTYTEDAADVRRFKFVIQSDNNDKALMRTAQENVGDIYAD